MKIFVFAIALLFSSVLATAQNGGGSSFAFLNNPGSAKLAGLGNKSASVYRQDVMGFVVNPALINQETSNHVAFNQLIWPTGVGHSGLGYVYEHDKAGTFGVNLQYVGYGTIDGYDDIGNPIGAFRPAEYSIGIAHARQTNNFRFGGALKYAGSTISGFNAAALMVDIGGAFVHPEKDLVVGLVINNLGFLVADYSNTSNTSIPLDVRLGVTMKPEHMPVRFTVTAHHLHQWDISAPHEAEPRLPWLDMTMRHLVFGAEFIMGKNITALFGYNHQRRKELLVEDIGGISGFSFGLSMNVNAFDFTYAYGGYHRAGGTNNIGLSVNLNRLITKKNEDGQ